MNQNHQLNWWFEQGAVARNQRAAASNFVQKTQKPVFSNTGFWRKI